MAEGTCENLKSYLQNGGNPDLCDEDGTSLLHRATKDGDLGKMKVLIQHGCQINSQDKDGCTSVYIAVNEGHNSVLKELLQARALVNTVAFQHTTPLILAVMKKDTTFVKTLLEFGNCDIDMENYIGQTALTQALLSTNLEVCELLLQRGATVRCIYNKRFSIEIARILCHNSDLMKLLLQYSQNLDLGYHLMIACIYKQLDAAEAILQKFDNPFQLKALGFVTKQEEDAVWEKLMKSVVRPYKLATKCSQQNRFLMMMLGFCSAEPNESQKRVHKLRAKTTIRKLVRYGLVITPETTIKSCVSDCECRKCIFTSLYDHDPVSSLKGQCCSVIRQTLRGEQFFKFQDVEMLPLPSVLKQFLCMEDW